MEELKISREKVIEAAGKCSTAKEILKTLFPEVFESKFDKHKIYAITDNYNNVHKLHCIKGNWAFISLDNSCNISYREFDSPEILIKELERITRNEVKCFSTQKEFLQWCMQNY